MADGCATPRKAVGLRSYWYLQFYVLSQCREDKMDSSDKVLSVSRHLAAAVQGKKCLDSNDKDIAERRALALPCLEVIPEVYRDCACIEHQQNNNLIR